MALTRGIGSALLAEISKSAWFPILLVHLDWPGGAVRVHSGVGSITWGGFTWGGVGAAGRIETPGEGISGTAGRATLTLFGAPADLLTQADAQIRNRPGAIYLGAVTQPAGNVLVGDPIAMFEGFMDALRFTIGGEGDVIEHALQLDLGSGPSMRQMAAILHSNEDQSLRYPGDTAGRHLINIEARVSTLRWPAS
jgi:hypothetical protein